MVNVSFTKDELLIIREEFATRRTDEELRIAEKADRAIGKQYGTSSFIHPNLGRR